MDLGSGRALAHRGDDRFAMCELDLQQAVFIDPAVSLPNSPVTAPHAGGTMSLAQLCAGALQRSDNAAANLLLRRSAARRPSPNSLARSATTGPGWIAGRSN